MLPENLQKPTTKVKFKKIMKVICKIYLMMNLVRCGNIQCYQPFIPHDNHIIIIINQHIITYILKVRQHLSGAASLSSCFLAI